jgi:IS5 family transposase
VNADAKHKLIRHYAVTDAAVHDSQELDGLLDEGSTCNDVFADSAYRSAEIEAKLRASGCNSRIHRRGRRNHALSLATPRAGYALASSMCSGRGRISCERSAWCGRAPRSGLQNLAFAAW